MLYNPDQVLNIAIRANPEWILRANRDAQQHSWLEVKRGDAIVPLGIGVHAKYTWHPLSFVFGNPYGR